MLKNGCHLYNDCWTCFFPDCYKYSPVSVERYYRRLKAKELWNKGLACPEIAQEIGVCSRTVGRDLNTAIIRQNIALTQQ